jgi:hypothetical protein
MKSKMDMLDKWIGKLIFPGEVEDFVKEIKNLKYEGYFYRETCIYTDAYKYRLCAIDRVEDEGYLGCQVSARKARAGEDWTRGNDLRDGPFLKETWFKILSSIINYELVKLSKFKQPDSIPEE